MLKIPFHSELCPITEVKWVVMAHHFTYHAFIQMTYCIQRLHPSKDMDFEGMDTAIG